MAAHDAASGTDLAMRDWNPVGGSADADLLPDLDTLTARSRDLGRNNGLMAGAMQKLRDNVVGAVLQLSATPDYRLLGWTREQAREWGNLTEAKFRSWAETPECDAARTQNLLGLTLQALGGAMLNGDALALPLWLPRPGARWNTRLMTVESDRLATPIGLEHREDIRKGIEFDKWGAPVAYHFLKRHPGDAFAFGFYGMTRDAQAMEWDRVPAFTPWGRRRVIHLHDKERTGQSRGKPVVSAVMREFHVTGKYATNELQASLANSLVAAFLESDLDPASAAELFGENQRDAWNASAAQPPPTSASSRAPRSSRCQPVHSRLGATSATTAGGRRATGFGPARSHL